MPTVQDILKGKGSHVHSISPSATVLDAVGRMNQHKIGALLVMTGDQVAGVFTERDVLRRVMADGLNPGEVSVGQVMTTEVICCEPSTDIDDAAVIMQERRVRHLPVCDADGRVRGMVSIGDINAWHVSHQEQTIHFLSDYIYGRV